MSANEEDNAKAKAYAEAYTHAVSGLPVILSPLPFAQLTEEQRREVWAAAERGVPLLLPAFETLVRLKR